MDFEEMQVIWNEQNNEKLYAINEESLHAYIRKKGRSITRSISFVDWMMMLVNLGIGVFLFWQLSDNNDGFWQVLLPGFYIMYGLAAFVVRAVRKQREPVFPDTMVGDLDRSLWRVNYLMQLNTKLMIYYLFPICIAGAMYLVSKEDYGMALFMVTLLPLGSYMGGRWENNRFHGPRKAELLALKEKLTDAT